jgi:Ribosomal protein S20
MPITKSAIKKQRVDKGRARVNEPIRGRVKSSIKAVRATPTKTTIASLYSALDHAVTKKLMSKRTAGRLKSRVTKFARKTLTTSPFAK